MTAARGTASAALALGLLAACLGTGTRRVDAACREMRAVVVWELLRDNPTIKLVDLRSPDEVTQQGRLPNARQIPLDHLTARLAELGEAQETTVVVFGRFGDAGRRGCQILASHGFKYVIFISDGADGWFRQGLPSATSRTAAHATGG